MKVIVFGATGASGRLIVKELERRGHQVTSFVRDASRAPTQRFYVGDALHPASVDAAVAGHDAAIITLGISENPLTVRLKGASATATNVRSEGTRNILQALENHGIRRVIVQSSYGVGPSREHLSLKWKMIFSLFLKPQIADTEVQEEVVRASNLDWSLIQPVGLTDNEAAPATISTRNEIASFEVPRATVAEVVADVLPRDEYIHQTVAVSA